MTLCLITDRRRLAASLGEPEGEARRLLLAQIEGAVAGGVDVVQVREPDLEARLLAGLVRDILAAASGTATRVVVNDRLDVALAAAAAGVHLRETSIGVTEARRLAGPGVLIGRSVHDARGARLASEADYLVAASVYATASKPDAPASLGLEGLRAVVKAAGACPVWALGGMTIDRMPEVRRCGVRGVAAIGAFIPTGPGPDTARAVQKMAEALRFSFDTTAGLS